MSTRNPKLETSFFRQLATALAPFLEEQLGRANEHKDFYSQKDSPLGRRAHLELVRSGALPGSKVGKLVLVRRDAMHEYIREHEIQSGGGGREDDDYDGDPLEDWGLERGAK